MKILNDYDLDTVERVMRRHLGKANMKTKYELIEECEAISRHYFDERYFRNIISYLIDVRECPILSTPTGGYFWYSPDHDDDRTDCYRRERGRGLSILKRTRKANRACLAEKARAINMRQQELWGKKELAGVM